MSKVVSLRKFRDSIAEFTEPVEVSRRDGRGNHQIIGIWTPTSGGLPPPTYRELVEADGGQFIDLGIDPGVEGGDRTVIIKTADDARAMAATLPAIHPVPKPSQQKKTRRSR